MKVFNVQGEMFDAGKDVPVGSFPPLAQISANKSRHMISNSIPPLLLILRMPRRQKKLLASE